MQTSPATAPEQAPSSGRFAARHPFDDRPTDGSRRGGKVRDGKGTGSQFVGRQFAAGVETKPAHPQHGCAQGRVGQVVRRHRFAAVSQTLADQQRTDQRRDTRADMHHGAAGKIQSASGQPPAEACLPIRRGDESQDAAVPHPVAERTVDQRPPQHHEDHHRAEFHAFGKRPADECRRDDEEHALKQHVRQQRYLGWLALHVHWRKGSVGRIVPAARHVVHRQVLAIANPLPTTAECQRVTPQRPDDGH